VSISEGIALNTQIVKGLSDDEIEIYPNVSEVHNNFKR